MPTIVAVYESEKDLDATLNTLHEMDVESKNVVIMSPNTDSSAPEPHTAPIAASNQGPSITNTPGLAANFYHGGTITDMDIGMEEQDFYNRIVDNGGTVLFVEVEMDRVNAVESAMDGATRIDRL